MPEQGSRQRTYSISEMAAEFDTSPRAIRYYEERGLLKPRRTAGNQRVYTRRDRRRLKLILRGKRLGFSLDEIAEMIGAPDTDMNEAEQIRRSLAHGRARLAEIARRKAELAELEQDILATMEKLEAALHRLLEEGEPHEPR